LLPDPARHHQKAGPPCGGEGSSGASATVSYSEQGKRSNWWRRRRGRSPMPPPLRCGSTDGSGARCCCGSRCCAHGPDGDLKLRLPGSAEARAPCQRGGVPRALHDGGVPAPARRLRLELGRILLRRRTRRRKRECKGGERKGRGTTCRPAEQWSCRQNHRRGRTTEESLPLRVF
jgi:hypothetical protein